MQGILLVDKPKDITSHDAVYKLRKKTSIKKIGHTGTLDPIATGLLPIAIGNATKLSDYLIGKDKKYIAKARFGFETDTLDITGNIVSKTENIPQRTELLETLRYFIGDISQLPPMYSAKKINGKKLYEYAREGKIVERKANNIKIYNLKLISFNNNEFEILIDCSSGTYVRTLLSDIAHKLNSQAVMTELRRISIGEFKIEDAFKLSDILDMDNELIKKNLISMDMALNHLPIIKLDDENYIRLINGAICTFNSAKENMLYRLYCKNNFIGIGVSPKDGKVKVKKRLINL